MTASTGNLVIDASAAVALVSDRGPAGRWVAGEVAGTRLHAPGLLPYEVINTLRRHVLAGLIDEREATAARADLTAVPIDLWPHARVADRAWALRGAVTYYDATYVALAESLDASLVTLDGRLARANGPMCEILAPPE